MSDRRKPSRRRKSRAAPGAKRGKGRGKLRARGRTGPGEAHLKTVYAPIEPYSSGHLKVGSGHEIYYEECGNPAGRPALFVHGGPGAGAGAKARQFFDPDLYRIVLFDQRGCGRSRPHASLVDNTTWHLIDDIERLREHLGIDRWLVFGGSWGSTLGLAYAERHPERVAALVLRGIFLLRRSELEWFYQRGASAIYPDRFEQYVAPIPAAERSDLMAAFYRRLTSDQRDEALTAARAWALWEASTSYLRTNEENVRNWGEADFALAVARIECHYFVNNGFFERENQLLEDIDRIRHIPAVIVQGRYDVVCPMQTAWELHKVWPEADFRVVPDAGHSAFEPGITHELVTATDRFARVPEDAGNTTPESD
ncbi:MAG TPA: prolyl aminopeptidase [Steroidobacteraceae bacterium]|nr:prolyl aminopeptidase [Steroidobacteraceae bacterium]